MKNSLRIVTCFLVVTVLWACERPKSPNFKLNHNVEAPLTVNKTYRFMGGDDALIDSTSEDFADLFTTGSNGLVQLSKQQDFDFGDLNDAIPEVNVDETTVNPQVGEIELTDFASSGDVGSVSAEDITGDSNLQNGDPLLNGSANDVKIDDFDPDYFDSATIKQNGKILIKITNNLGFNADNNLTVTLNSNGTPVGSDNIKPLNHGTTKTAQIPVSAGDQLSNLGVEIDVGWSGQNMQADGGNLVVEEVTGQDDSDPSKGLIASEVTAAVEPQSFDTNGSSTVNNNSFEFRNSSDEIVLSDSVTQSANKLNLDITNNLSIAIQSLDITFPEIEDPQGSSLTINLQNIPGNSSESHSYDISEHTITSETVTYTVDAQTENTQNSNTVRTIKETDDVVADVGLDGLDIGTADGYIVPKLVLLNDDVTNDGRNNLDVFNDEEAEITKIDGLSDISNRISDITFENPKLITKYLTNLGVNTAIYAAIVGTDAKGNTVYLTGNSGSKYDVSSSEIPNGLEANGQQLTEDKVIKFNVQTASNPNPNQGEEGENIFNSETTNSSEFFSNFPTSIRFAGIARVNEAQKEDGEIVNPVIFDPTLNFDLPFNFSADNASFKDTVDADLGDLPGQGDDSQLSEATFTINYENGLPLDLDFAFIMLDQNGNEVSRKEGIQVGAASTNGDGLVEQGGKNENKTEISFTKEELQNLNNTRSMVLDIGINTPKQNAVKVRASDTIKFYMQMKVKITSTVN